MPKGSQGAVMALGKHAKYSPAGALNLATGGILHCRSAQKTHALFRDWLTLLDHADPAPWITRLAVVVDNYCIHQAKPVEQWIQNHSRFGRLWFGFASKVKFERKINDFRV
jgi:hypothetical protein